MRQTRGKEAPQEKCAQGCAETEYCGEKIARMQTANAGNSVCNEDAGYFTSPVLRQGTPPSPSGRLQLVSSRFRETFFFSLWIPSAVARPLGAKFNPPLIRVVDLLILVWFAVSCSQQRTALRFRRIESGRAKFTGTSRRSFQAVVWIPNEILTF